MPGPFAASLVTAGASLLGSIFGKPKRQRAPGVDYVKLRNDAERAGFNPLTALLAGGGAGYQREFNPALSSGSFIAEAISRGVDTYFDGAQRAEEQAAQIRREQEDRMRWEVEQRLRPAQRFGYALTDQRPFLPRVTQSVPKLSAASARAIRAPVGPTRPLSNPLSRDNPTIPVRFPDNSKGQLDASIARRNDIRPFETVAPGELVDMVGEWVGEMENMTNAPAIRDTVTRRVYPGGVSRFGKGPAGTPVKPPPMRSRSRRPSATQGVYDRVFGPGKIKVP